MERRVTIGEFQDASSSWALDTCMNRAVRLHAQFARPQKPIALHKHRPGANGFPHVTLPPQFYCSCRFPPLIFVVEIPNVRENAAQGPVFDDRAGRSGPVRLWLSRAARAHGFAF